MEFCHKCGSIILVNDNKAVCAKCGYRPKGKIKIQVSEKMAKPEGVAVIREKELATYPVVEMKCPECKYKEAYFWTLQTRSSDESETKFYRCTKCEHTWRDYK
ncbi:MAG: transcription factor S [Nanoarchaeota archaeon]|nr:transcription factor S [Nanoarchaeota archaeon]